MFLQPLFKYEMLLDFKVWVFPQLLCNKNEHNKAFQLRNENNYPLILSHFK